MAPQALAGRESPLGGGTVSAPGRSLFRYLAAESPIGVSGSPQQAGQMTDCRAGLGTGGGEKSQTQPWPCACRHCGVNIPPSGPRSLSRLVGGRWAGREVRRRGGRETETQGVGDGDTQRDRDLDGNTAEETLREKGGD